MKILEQKVEDIAIDAVRPHPRNPRLGNIDLIKSSIDNNGFYGAVIAQKSTGYILAGNHRWQAAVKSDAIEIPVIWLDIDDDHALRILLADNRTSDVATYDNEMLMEILNELAEETGTLLGTGYDEDELNALLTELEEVPESSMSEIDADSFESGHTCPRCGFKSSE